MKISYRKTTNSGKLEYEAQIHIFLKEFHFLFTAKLIPPFSVVYDLCNSRPCDWRANNRIEWDSFEISEVEYQEAANQLISLLGLAFVEVPENIDTSYKWSLWQYQVSHQVPYEQFRKLSDIELKCHDKLEHAKESGDEVLISAYHLDLIEAADNVSEFLDQYLGPH